MIFFDVYFFNNFEDRLLLNFSIIIPVYNRPQEINALLESLVLQDFSEDFEVLIIEDGSEHSSEKIVEKYTDQLRIHYHFKENTGAGDSRNFGMQKASGDYCIILDSDIILPKQYLSEVQKALSDNFTDAFGGPDAAHQSFTSLQKAINYSMTSLLTTGGIRGKKKAVGKFQPRSFNFGISKKAFEKTQGFSTMKNGEDIDLSLRLWENGFETQLIETAFVYHKRRSNLMHFFEQTYGFGTARPVLNARYPQTAKWIYWFPSIWSFGLLLSVWVALLGQFVLIDCYAVYLALIFSDSFVQNKNIHVAFLSIFTSMTQFFGYGLGFLTAQFSVKK